MDVKKKGTLARISASKIIFAIFCWVYWFVSGVAGSALKGILMRLKLCKRCRLLLIHSRKKTCIGLAPAMAIDFASALCVCYVTLRGNSTETGCSTMSCAAGSRDGYRNRPDND